MEDPTKGKSCSVCFSDFKKFRRAIICPFCPDVLTCRDCVKDYLLGSDQDAHCMSCKHQWNYAFMYNSFPETFLTKEYRKSRQRLALEREKALLPDTLPLVDEEKKKIEIRKEIEVINVKKAVYMERIRKLKIKTGLLDFEIREHKNSIKDVRNTIKRVQYIGPCPADKCRGFIEPDTHRCGLCEIYICRKCHEILGMGEENLKKLKKRHTCDENTVETVKDIKKMTKPCPKCQTAIFKIEGCFAPKTPILLYSGEKIKASDVKVGMKLMGDDGTPRIVEELVSGEDEMFLIKQTKAESYIVNSQHKLVLKYSGGEIIDIPVSEYLNLSAAKRNKLTGVNTKILSSNISVTGIGKGEYYGWKVSGLNKRFVLPDFTVVHNCDQMFCTQCRTPFSWNTGDIITGVIHNPHYYEMMRNMGTAVRNVGDVPCGGLPMHHQFDQFLRVLGDMNYFNNYETTPDNVQIFMSLVHRRAGEIDAHITRRRGEILAANNKAEQRRLDFLIGKIKTEKEFQAAIFRDERMRQKKEEESQILSTFLAGVIERMNDFIQTCTEETEKRGAPPIKKFVENKATAFMKDVKKMVRFCNKAFQDNYTAMSYKKFPQIVLIYIYSTSKLFDKRIIVGKEPTDVKTRRGRR
jgi:Hom_end-associated Hint